MMRALGAVSSWVRKEAVLHSFGTGGVDPISPFSLVASTQRCTRLSRLDRRLCRLRQGFLQLLETAPGYWSCCLLTFSLIGFVPPKVPQLPFLGVFVRPAPPRPRVHLSCSGFRFGSMRKYFVFNVGIRTRVDGDSVASRTAPFPRKNCAIFFSLFFRDRTLEKWVPASWESLTGLIY